MIGWFTWATCCAVNQKAAVTGFDFRDTECSTCHFIRTKGTLNVCTRSGMNIRLTTIVFFLLFSIFASSPNLGLSTWSNIIIVIVNRCDWLGSPANIKGANKDAKIYVGRSATLHILLFRPHTLCMNYVTNTFLLVCSSISGKQPLCFVQGQGQKREQKHTTKNF